MVLIMNRRYSKKFLVKFSRKNIKVMAIQLVIFSNYGKRKSWIIKNSCVKKSQSMELTRKNELENRKMQKIYLESMERSDNLRLIKIFNFETVSYQ